jgi:hypothetical protein
VVDVARARGSPSRVLLLVGGHEFLHAGKVEPVVPGGAEDAEDRVGAEAVDVGPVLLVVHPRRGLVELELHDLLPQRLDVVAAHAVATTLGLICCSLEQVGAEVARVLRDHQLLDDPAAVGLDDWRVAFAVLWPQT